MSVNVVVPSDCCFAVGDGPNVCQLCGGNVELAKEDLNRADKITSGRWEQEIRLFTCLGCGWWVLNYKGWIFMPDYTIGASSHSYSILRECQIGDKGIPVGQLKKYLKSHIDDIYAIHPQKLEEIIYAIFREHGFIAQLKSYSKDGGIDILLFESPNGEPTAVQVKRNRQDRKIGVEEIHQFLGVLLVNGLRRGVYVTTSTYTRGSRLIPQNSYLTELGIQLELVDIEKIVEFLKPLRPSLNDPLEVAWNLRAFLPMEMDMPGDWYGAKFWPTMPPTKFHVDWWTSEYKRILHTIQETNISAKIPTPLTAQDIQERVHQILPETYIEITSLNDDGLRFHYERGRFTELKNDTIVCSSFGFPLHERKILDIREWRPTPGYEVINYGSKIGQRPRISNGV